MKLTEKQEMACRLHGHYGKNKSDAYREAYNTSNMKPATVNRKAKKLFDQGKIRARVDQLKTRRSTRLNYDADKVLQHLLDIINADILDIYNVDTGSFKPLEAWPKIWRQMLISKDICDVKSNEGVKTEIIKVRFFRQN